jgi:hypothetical protein
MIQANHYAIYALKTGTQNWFGRTCSNRADKPWMGTCAQMRFFRLAWFVPPKLVLKTTWFVWLIGWLVRLVGWLVGWFLTWLVG